MFKQSKFYTSNTLNTFIFLIIAPFHTVHSGDYGTRGWEYRQRIWPKHGWGANTRLRLLENITLYLNASIYNNQYPQINHCLNEICHFYLLTGCEDIPHLFRQKTNIINDEMTKIFNFN